MQSSESIDRLRDDGKWLKAAALLASDLAEESSSRHKWVDYAHMLKEGGAFEHAVYAYRAAIRRDGTAPDPRLHLSHLLKRIGRVEDALVEFLALDQLPNAPHVGQEIAGLRVSLLQEKWPSATASQGEEIGGDADCEAAFQRLKLLEDQRIAAAPDPAHSAGSPSRKSMGSRILPFGLLASSKELRATLVPQSDLIIRDDVLIATTNAPQFRVEIEGERLQPGWFEIELHIKAPVPFIEPVFFAEHAAEWSVFSFYRLQPVAAGEKFYALCYCEAPFERLRLDPVTFAGPFEVSRFKIRQVGLANAVRAAHGKNAAATRLAVRNIRTHRSAQSFEREIANILRYPGKSSYRKWIDIYGTQTAQQIGVRIRTASRWQKPPLFSLIVAISSLDTIETLLKSLADQQYGGWQASFIPSAMLTDGEKRRLAEMLRGDTRFILEASLLSSVNTASGDYTVILDANGFVAPDALYRCAERFIAQPAAELVYVDEDHIDKEGARHAPLFKPDWDFDYFLASGYLGSLVAIRTATLREAIADADLSSDLSPFEVVARCALGLDSRRISHIPSILYHRHTSSAAPESVDAIPFPKTHFDPQVIEKLLHRTNSDATIEGLPSGLVKVCWPLPKSVPKVTLIIPTRDRVSLLSSCIDSLLRETAYPSFDILIVDNDSVESKTLDYFQTIQANGNIKVVSIVGDFNYSRLNNVAAQQASGDIIGLVNNDILAIDDKWLTEMVSHAIRPDVGAVGARLIYKSGHIQHAGIVCGIGLVAGHPHKFRAAGDLGYMGRIAATQTLSAVTAACLVVEKRKYWEVGGLDEENLQIAFNDVDLCLKLDAAGYRNIYTPYAELVHLESISRGLDTSLEKAERYQKEATFMMQKWSARIKRDPYYNPNLTLEREDYSLRD